MGNAPHSMNIVSDKYDTSLDYHVTMYDNLPYKRDSEYCNIEKVALCSGRVIKYYLCVNQPESRVIDNKDSQIEEMLAEILLEEKKRLSVAEPEVITDTASEAEVTSEQIQTLLEDNAADTFADSGQEDNGIDAPEDAVNAFSDVEDW